MVSFSSLLSSFITSHLSFDSAIGLQMNSGSSVTTIRSDRPSSVTKFGEKMHTPLFLYFLILLHMRPFCTTNIPFS